MSRFQNGYFKFWRRVAFDDIASRNFETLWVFTRLMAMATLQETEIMRGGKLVKIKPGEIVTSLEELSFNGKVDMQKIRRALHYLEKRQTIRQSSDNQGRVITICNWDKYQTSLHQSDRQVMGEEHASDMPVTSERQRIEELKNIRTKEHASSTKIFDERFNQENQPFIQRLDELQVNSTTIRNKIFLIRQRFKSVEELNNWIQGLAENNGFKSKDSAYGRKQYLEGALIKECGMVAS